MKKKMAFVDLTNYKDWPMGGMLEYELAILKHLVGEYDVDIWGVSVDGKINDSLIINGEKYLIHIFGNAKTKRKVIPNYWRGLELYSKRKEFPRNYDVVYLHTGSCVAVAKRMVDRRRTKLVYHQHGLNHRTDFTLRSLIQRPGLSMAQKAADLVFVVSDTPSVEEFAKEMHNKTKARFVPIGSPLNLERFNTEEARQRIKERDVKEAVKFLYTGRLTVYKDVKTLIEVMKKIISERNDKAVLTVAGSGDEFENLKAIVKKHHLENHVKLLGAVPHDKVYKLLQDSDMFVTASGGEGVSVSVLEAYASGLPVVCFNVPGLERQVIDGVTGVIAKERSVKGFYDAVLLADSNRTQLAYNCLEEAKKYDSVHIASKIIKEINKLMEK